MDETLGRIKFLLIEKGNELNDVKVQWKEQVVQIKGAQVAKVQADGTFETHE